MSSMTEKVDTIEITIDGRPVEVERGAMLLAAIRDAGGDVPTLCHHPSLEPNGACRLCSVEITHADWKGWSGLVTSCLYPAEPGLEVSTRSSGVKELRRTLLELYLSRCPDAEEIRTLARNEGIDASSYPVRDVEEADKCVLCGLCTRVCHDLGPAAIAPLSRGKDKAVGPNPDMIGEDCTCCGACALICPTDEIVLSRRDNKYTIWNREFDIPVAKVNDERCRGCGICEEVCPEAIPRVQIFKNGGASATIVAEACTGCGICVGACPTGAIEQDAFPFELQSTGAAAGDGAPRGPQLFACSRSTYPASTENVTLVPCIGRVPMDGMLESLARGADGVQLVCRDQATCPHAIGGRLGQQNARTAADLALLAGLGRNRVQYVQPAPGPEGPVEALRRFADSLDNNPLKENGEVDSGINCDAIGGGNSGADDAAPRAMDRALALMRSFRSRPELTPELPDSLAALFTEVTGAPAQKPDTVLYLGDLPELDLLLSGMIDSWRVKNLIEDAVRLLREKEIAFMPAWTAQQVAAIGPSRIFAFTERDLALFDDSYERTTLDRLAGASSSPDKKSDDAPGDTFRFHITQEERKSWMEQLQSASDNIVCRTPRAVAQYKLLARQGTWHHAFLGEPRMAFSDSVRAAAGRESE